MAASFAMALDIPLKEFIERVGHDGSSKPDGEHEEGFHVQECIEVAQVLGFAVTPIEQVPQAIATSTAKPQPIWFPNYNNGPEPEVWNRARFTHHLMGNMGVITGVSHSGKGHAIAWNGYRVFDPRATHHYIRLLVTCELYGFHPQCFWKLQRAI